jgi:hypothetical protein
MSGRGASSNDFAAAVRKRARTQAREELVRLAEDTQVQCSYDSDGVSSESEGDVDPRIKHLYTDSDLQSKADSRAIFIARDSDDMGDTSESDDRPQDIEWKRRIRATRAERNAYIKRARAESGGSESESESDESGGSMPPLPASGGVKPPMVSSPPPFL